MAGVYQVSPSCFHLLKLQRLAVALRVRGSSGSDPSAGTRGAVARPVMTHAARWGEWARRLESKRLTVPSPHSQLSGKLERLEFSLTLG